MTTQRILLAALTIGCCINAEDAFAQFRGRIPNGGGNRPSGPPSFPQGNLSAFSKPSGSNAPRFNLAPTQVGLNNASVNPANNSKFHSFSPNAPGTNSARIQLAPNQVGVNSPSAGGSRPFQSIAPSQPGANVSQVNVGGSGFGNFNNGFGGSTSGGSTFGGQQFAGLSSGTVSTPLARTTNFSSAASSFPSAGSSSFNAPSFGSTAQSLVQGQSFAGGTQTSLSPTRPPVLQSQFSNGPIKIVLPKSYPIGVNYVLNEFTYAMRPGQHQAFSEDRDWVVRFDRGGSLGTCEYSLSPGNYAFVCDSASGWELYRLPANGVSVQ